MAIYIGSSKKTIRVGSSFSRVLLIPELVSIAVTTPPTKTKYNPFTSFNPAGMVVTAEYDNGEKKTITDYTITNGDYLTADMTSVTISYTARGITKTTTQDIRVNHIKLNIPYSNDTFVYTGSEMTPVWTGYDSSLMTIGGDTSGTNAGTYSTNFALKDKINYQWSDGTTEDKAVNWVIEKAQASVTLDKTSVVLNSDKLSDVVTFSSVGMKSVMVMSSDMSVATVSMEGNVITISSVNETTGTANIIINGEVDSNYNAPEYPSIEVSAEFIVYATVTITGTGDATHSYVTIDGVKYTGATTVVVPIGTTIYCYVRSKNEGYADIMLPNNEHIYAETKDGSYYYAEYNYAVSGNVQIGLSYSSMITAGGIVIIEIPEGHALVTITGSGYNMAYNACSVTIDGINYTAATVLAVPIGTTITCYICNHSSSYGPAYVKVNGNTMLSAGASVASYDFTVNRDTSIALKSDRDKTSDGGGRCGYITITET